MRKWTLLLLFGKNGSNTIGIDLNQSIIENANHLKEKNNSKVIFYLMDANLPEKLFTKHQFDIIFMSGLSLFGLSFNDDLMKKYLSLLTPPWKIDIHS